MIINFIYSVVASIFIVLLYSNFDYYNINKLGNHFEEIIDARCTKESWEPKTRMVFDSFDNLFQNDKRYGNTMGFEAILRTSKKRDNEEVKYATLACSCIGKSRSNSKNVLKMKSNDKKWL